MDFWNLAVPGLLFLAPLAAILFFTLKGRGGTADSEINIGLALFGLMLLVSAIGFVRFEQPVKSEFLWALTMEPSGYFEFSLQMHWLRYVWIFFTGAVLLGFTAFDGPVAMQGERPGLRFLFLISSFLFSALAYLSENVMLSFMFVEITVFLLHAFGVESGGEEGELERVSYFKRSCFLVLGLISMLGLAATGLFSTPSVILMGVVLYVISSLFAKHHFHGWRYLALFLVHMGACFFLLGQVLHDDRAAIELWLPLSAVFALFAIVFSAFCLLSLETLNSAFWLVCTFVAYLLFLRFSSAKPADAYWGTYEAIGLASTFALGTLFRYGGQMDFLWKRILSFVLMAVLLGIVSGAVPGLETASTRFDGETSLLKVLALGLVTFLVAMVTSKSLLLSFQSKEPAGGAANAFWKCLVPASLVLAVQIGAMFRLLTTYNENPIAFNLPGLLYDTRVLVTGSALALGLLAGAFLGANSSFVGWIRNRERRMEDLFPRIDPAVVGWNQRLVRAPEEWLEAASGKLNGVGGRAAGLLERLDHALFGEKFFRGFTEYGASLSGLVRMIHSGNVRMYMFLGVLITLFSSFLFLLEGK